MTFDILHDKSRNNNGMLFTNLLQILLVCMYYRTPLLIDTGSCYPAAQKNHVEA